MPENSIEAIGRYHITRKLGQGAMGVVYLAHDHLIDRSVAIKCLRLDKSKSEAERAQVRDLFFKEAKIIGKLTHSHIAAIYDMGIEGEDPFLVMEFVDGRTIKELMDENEALSIRNRILLISMAARAIHYAHQRGVLHRDIKPANIMIMGNSSPKIMDFGIARLKDAASSDWSEGAVDESGIILGTPHYMSPEQIRGKKLDPKTDIFSLGILTYEWLCGQKPFRGKSLKELLTSIIKSDPKPLSTLCQIDGELEKIIHKALEKEPNSRYQTAEDYSDALELYLNMLEKEAEPPPTASGSFNFKQFQIVEQLKKNYVFFSDFTEEELFNIFKLSNKEKFQPGDVIIQEGTSGTKMYIIITGKVSIMKDMDGKPMQVKTLGEGDCFGELTIMDKMPRSASVIAMEPTVLIAINEIVLRNSNPTLCLKLYRNLAAVISEKLRMADKKYFELVSKVGETTAS